MKTISIVFTLVWIGVNVPPAQLAQTKPASEDATSDSIRYEEAERGAHHRVVATVR